MKRYECMAQRSYRMYHGQTVIVPAQAIMLATMKYLWHVILGNLFTNLTQKMTSDFMFFPMEFTIPWTFVMLYMLYTKNKSLYFTRNNKFGADDTTSRDSDSLIQEYINVPPSEYYTHCWNHPKIRENWRTVLAAVTLLIIGVALLTMGVISICAPANGSRGFVFLLAGMFHWPFFFVYFATQNTNKKTQSIFFLFSLYTC